MMIYPQVTSRFYPLKNVFKNDFFLSILDRAQKLSVDCLRPVKKTEKVDSNDKYIDALSDEPERGWGIKLYTFFFFIRSFTVHSQAENRVTFFQFSLLECHPSRKDGQGWGCE